MRCFKPFGNLAAYCQSFVNWQRPFAQPLRQALSFDKLHHDEAFTFSLFESVDRGDVGMIE